MRSIVDQLNETVPAPEDLQPLLALPLGALEPDPEQPRKSFEAIDELAASIAAIGIQQPLLVRLHPEKPGAYFIVAGERRWRAAKRAGVDQVPCRVLPDAQDLGRRKVIQLTENLQRQDVPILETARALQEILASTTISKQELAALLGKKPAFLSKHLALLEAQGNAAQALAEGLILSPETFRLFTKLPESRQRILLAQARRLQAPISRGDVAAAAQPTPASARQGNAEPRPQRFKLQLTVAQVRWLFEKLGGDLPDDATHFTASLRSLFPPDETDEATETNGEIEDEETAIGGPEDAMGKESDR